MIIKIHKRLHDNAVIVDENLLKNVLQNLSSNAGYLLLICLAMSNNSTFEWEHIENTFKIPKEYRIQALEELEKAGYCYVYKDSDKITDILFTTIKLSEWGVKEFVNIIKKQRKEEDETK